MEAPEAEPDRWTAESDRMERHGPEPEALERRDKDKVSWCDRTRDESPCREQDDKEARDPTTPRDVLTLDVPVGD